MIYDDEIQAQQCNTAKLSDLGAILQAFDRHVNCSSQWTLRTMWEKKTMQDYVCNVFIHKKSEILF